MISNRTKRMWAIRQAGNTLQQVGNEFFITRERARVILQENYGTTKLLGLISFNQAEKSLRTKYKVPCPTKTLVLLLCERIGIEPIKVGKCRHWFTPSQIEKIAIILMARKSCKICGGVVPLPRQYYCSDRCLIESTRYKNRSPEQRAKHIQYVRRWLLAHPEKAREMRRKASKKYRAKETAILEAGDT